MEVKTFFLVSALLAVIFAVSIIQAYPSNDNVHQDNAPEENKVSIRIRRSAESMFDAIANGVEGGLQGLSKVGNSIKIAFEGVFSSDNKNAISDGFTKFTQGIKNAFNGFFGVGGESVKKGFKKLDNAVKKGLSPSGEVPEEETT